MKKKIIFLSFILTGLPVIAAGNYTYSNLGPDQVYSNANMKYSVTAKSSPAASSFEDSMFLQSMLYGASLATGRLNILATPSIRTARAGLIGNFIDPYIVNINNKSYVLVKDSKNNEWTVDNILGTGDERSDLFASLKALNSDGDASKITSKELKKANIRFVLLNYDGSLALEDRKSDYDLNNVKYIDMNNLRTALGNKNQDGTFGYFYVVINENGEIKYAPGRVTFEEEKDLKKYIK